MDFTVFLNDSFFAVVVLVHCFAKPLQKFAKVLVNGSSINEPCIQCIIEGAKVLQRFFMFFAKALQSHYFNK
jgi:hypothetical protein